VELREAPAATAEQLRAAIREFQPHVVHFTGHGHSPLRTLGAGRPSMPTLVCGAPGHVEYFTAGDMLAAIRDTPAAIFVFNCCFGAFSDTFAASFAGGLLSAAQVRVVIANQGSISVAAAAAFSVRLYRTLALGQPVDTAVAEFRRMLVQKHALGEDGLDWGMPVVYQRDAVARLWEFIQSDAAPVDFGRIFAAYEFFVGRAFLDGRIRQYVEELRAAGRGGGVFLLTAAPGVGKTAFLVEFIRRRTAAVIHFLYRATEGYRDPEVCLRCIYNSVLARYGWLEREPKYSVLGLQELLKRAGAESLARGEMQLIVIDALDEAATERGPSAADVIPAVIPAGVCVIAACRPGPIADELLARAGVEHFELAADSAESIEDARAASEFMIAALCPDAVRTDPEAIRSLAARLADKAEGNFLVLRAFFDAQRIDGQSLARLEEESGDLTSTVADVYKRFFDQRLVKEPGTSLEGRRAVYTVLQALASAVAPVTRAMVSSAFGLGSADWEFALGHVQQFLSEGGYQGAGQGETTYHLFHQTFREYLHERFGTDLPGCRQRWTEYCRSWRTLSGYARRYGLEHLPRYLQSHEARNELAERLLDLRFAYERFREIGPYGYTSYFRGLSRDAQIPVHACAELNAVHRVLDQNTHVLVRDPDAFLECVQNGLRQQLGDLKRTCRLTAGIPSSRPWLRLQNSPRLGSTGALVRTFVGHTAWVRSLAVDQLRGLLVSGSADRTVKVWELETGQLRRTLEGHSEPVYSVAMHVPRGLVIGGSIDGTIRVWQLETGHLRGILNEGHPFGVASVAVDEVRNLVVTGSWDRTVKVWDFEAGQLRRTLVGHTNWVPSAAVDEWRGLIVSGSGDRTIKIWDLETGELRRTLVGHEDGVNSVAVDRLRGLVVSGSGDRTIKVWDLETGELRRSLVGHGDGVNSVAVDSVRSLIVSGSDDRAIKVWDLDTGRPLSTLEGYASTILSVAVDETKGVVFGGTLDGTVMMWDLPTGQSRGTSGGHTGQIFSVTMDGARTLMASGSADQTVKVWDRQNGRLCRTLVGHTAAVFSVGVDRARRLVVSGSYDREVRVWDLESGELRHTLVGHADAVYSVAVEPVRGLVVSGSLDRTAKVWELETGRLQRTFKGHNGGIWCVAVDAVRGVGVTGAEDWTVKVWDLATGNERATLKGHRLGVFSVAVDAARGIVASGTYDHTVTVWDLQTGELRCTMRGHTDRVTSIAVHGERGLLVSGSRDRTVSLWDLNTGRLVLSREFPNEILAVSFLKGRPYFLAVAEAGEAGVPRFWEFCLEPPRA
jgi:WD40 repeat protein